MPFILEVTSPKGCNPVDSYIDVKYNTGKTISLRLGNLSKVIKAYDFMMCKRTIYVNIIQGATVQDFAFDVIMMPYREVINTRFDDLKLVETKINTVIQTLESAIPTLRKDFHIEYKFYTNRYNDHIKYPYILLIPELIVNEISDFLLSQYQQNYGTVTKLPPEFTPNENVQSPELQKFLNKLPLDLIAEAVIGTYGSAPAVLLPGCDSSQYLTGNERVVNLGENVVIVFGNPALEQQNKEEENSKTDPDKLEKVSNNVVAEGLGKQIQVIYETIIEGDTINNEEKKHRLETLNNVLDELGKTILDALKSQTPLDANELRKYAEDIVKSAGLSYINNFGNYLDYYEHSLTETEKLEVLATLLTYIGNTMYDIYKKIKEYNSLQLTYYLQRKG
jgi:hypothetical protein